MSQNSNSSANAARKNKLVCNFPNIVWNVFAGRCKAIGRTISDVLEEIIRKWLRDQEEL